MNTPLEYVQASFIDGMNQKVDPTRIGKAEYPLLINGRNRYDILQPVKLPLQEMTLPAGLLQGVYAAANYAVAFVAGKAYYKDYSLPNSVFTVVNGFQMSATAPTLWAELVPASTLNFQRIPTAATANAPVNLTSLMSSSPAALVVQDGETTPWIINTAAIARKAHTYTEWTVNDREYVPIGKMMLFHNGILYLVSVDGTQIYRSVSGRPLDFMVNVTNPAGDKSDPSEDIGGASTTSHRVGYDGITAMAALDSPDGGFFVSTPRSSTKVVPDFSAAILLFGEPQFDNVPLFPTGTLNDFSFVNILGDSAFVDFTGIRSFNAVLQYRNEGKNSPFSAKVFNLFKDIIQSDPCAGTFDNYGLFSMQTIYGAVMLVYDEINQTYVGFDIYPGVSAIKQFAEIKTSTFRKLLFRTADNKLYEGFTGGTATMSVYLGEWCSNDPKMEQTAQMFKVVLIDAKESGTLTLTPFIDRKRQTAIPVPITATLASNPIPLAAPFGNSSADTVQSPSFNIGRVQSGWKVGVLIEMNFDAAISHVSLSTEGEPQAVGPGQEAKDFARLNR